MFHSFSLQRKRPETDLPSVPGDSSALPRVLRNHRLYDDSCEKMTLTGKRPEKRACHLCVKFIADALGNKGDTSRAVIRNYFLNDLY